MVRKNTTAAHKTRRKRHLSLLPFLALLMVIIVVSGTYLLSNKVISKKSIENVVSQLNTPPEVDSKTEVDNKSTPEKKTISTPTDNIATVKQGPLASNIQKPEDGAESVGEISDLDTNVTSQQTSETSNSPLTTNTKTPPTSQLAPTTSQCGPAAQVITDFYAHLDKQQYFQDFNLSATSETHFKDLIHKLLQNPPIVSRETDDLFTILQNTAHFFRIIGKKNISVLKGILDREKTYFEKVLENFYTVTSIPGCSQEKLDLALTQEALYEYAGFFLNTMGGRLYLFRRDSISRMTVNLYAILIVDQANEEENNKYGIQLQTPINSLIAEIEATNDQLKLKDTYLDILYDLKVKYQ